MVDRPTVLSKIGDKIRKAQNFAKDHHPDTVALKIGELDLHALQDSFSSVSMQMDAISTDFKNKDIVALLYNAASIPNTPFRKAYEAYRIELGKRGVELEDQRPYSSLPEAAQILAGDLHHLNEMLRELTKNLDKVKLENFSLHTAFFVGFKSKSDHLLEFVTTLLDSAYSLIHKVPTPPYLTDRLLALAPAMGSFVSMLLSKNQSLGDCIDAFIKGGKDLALISHGTPCTDILQLNDFDPVLQQALSGFLNSPELVCVVGNDKQDYLDTLNQRNDIMKEWLAAQVNRITAPSNGVAPDSLDHEKIQKAIGTYEQAMADLTKKMNEQEHV